MYFLFFSRFKKKIVSKRQIFLLNWRSTNIHIHVYTNIPGRQSVSNIVRMCIYHIAHMYIYIIVGICIHNIVCTCIYIKVRVCIYIILRVCMCIILRVCIYISYCAPLCKTSYARGTQTCGNFARSYIYFKIYVPGKRSVSNIVRPTL